MIGPFRGKAAFLSNFYPCRVEFEGLVYPSVEAAYQAAKTLDIEVRKMFLHLSPGAAKRLGRGVAIRQDWNQVKLGVMEACLRSKFSDPALRLQLFQTGQEELVEVNWWHDTFWGSCNGVGENQLGRLLMVLREEGRR